MGLGKRVNRPAKLDACHGRCVQAEFEEKVNFTSKGRVNKAGTGSVSSTNLVIEFWATINQ